MDVSSLLKDVIAFVEVRSGNDNRSNAICKELESMGAQTRPTFTNDVTHVVFKEGGKRTWNKAKKLNVPLVSVTWLESCKLNNTPMPAKDFPAIVPEEVSSPFLKFNQRPRWKKLKSMQPCDFEEELARSAERVERKRRREMMANRFKFIDDSTPVAPSPRSVLALDTQARSPRAFPSLLDYYSPIPDTPSSLKERLEKILREREGLEMDIDTPSFQHEKPQQRRLFDCNATSSSSDENIVTSRLVQGVIKSLESDSESPQLDEPINRKPPINAYSPVSNTVDNSNLTPKSNSLTPSRKTRLSLKSPRRNSVGTSHASNNENDKQASESMSDRSKQSLKPLSPQDLNKGAAKVNPFAGATSADKEVVSLKDYKVNPTVSSLSSLLSDDGSGDHALAFKELAGDGKTLEEAQTRLSNFKSRRQSKMGPLFQTDDHDVAVERKTESAEPMSKNPPLQPKLSRKRHLFSKCQAKPLLDELPPDSQKEIIPKMPLASKEQMNDSLSSAKADASFLFSIGGHKRDKTKSNYVLKSHAMKGSKKKSSPDNNLSVSSESASQEKTCSQLVPSSCTQDDSAMRTQFESSMSVMYPSDASQANVQPRRRRSVRLSINEFSIKNSFVKKASKSQNKLSHPEISEEHTSEKSITSERSTLVEARKNSGAKRKRSRSSSGAMVSGENCKRQKKTKSLSAEEKVDLNTSSAADNEQGTSSKLRHARSLILANPDMLFKKDKYSMVMTSLHREEQDTVCSAVKKFGIFRMTKNVEASTTHVVCGDARRTLNILRAIARGCWVLRKDWVSESLEEGNWLLEEKYEMNKEFPSAKESRLQREKAGQGYKPSLFSKTGPIYVYSECTPPRDELVHLINLCCGSVTGSQTRAAVYVGDNHDPKRLVIHPTWILDSIMKLKTLNPSDYIVSSPVSASQREASPEF